MFHILYVTADVIKKRYESNRTEYEKLVNKIKLSKSGSGTVVLTDLMKWKLRHWAFIAPFIKKKATSLKREIGNVRI
jgi:hypothetical protein